MPLGGYSLYCLMTKARRLHVYAWNVFRGHTRQRSA